MTNRGTSIKKESLGQKRLKYAASNSQCSTRRIRINQDYRENRISELEDKIRDISDRIGFKLKRRECASNMNNYKECDNLTAQISSLKTEKRQLAIELAMLQKKDKKSQRYFQSKTKQDQLSLEPGWSHKDASFTSVSPSVALPTMSSSLPTVYPPLLNHYLLEVRRTVIQSDQVKVVNFRPQARHHLPRHLSQYHQTMILLFYHQMKNIKITVPVKTTMM